MTRDGVHKQAVEAYLSAPAGWYLLQIGTGVGKSKIAMDIIRALQPCSILVLVNSESLRDVGWPKEFDKFSLEEKYVKNTDILCYQSAYACPSMSYDLVIADELDFALTPEYVKVFTRNKLSFNRVLGLTATLTPDKELLVKTVFGPDVLKYFYTTQQAQSDNILNESRFTFVRYFLSGEKGSSVVNSKSGKFYFSENNRYNWLENQFKDAEESRDIARISGSAEEMERTARQYRYRRDQRAAFLYALGSAVKVSRQLISNILSGSPDNKVLVFSKRTSQADLINSNTFHSKNKKGNKAIEKFNKGEERVLGVCGALNRGVNLEGANNIIMEGYDGSSTVFQQRHGRGTRLQVGETLNVYILVPCYINQRDGKECYTQAAEWVLRMSENFDLQGRSESIMFHLNQD